LKFIELRDAFDIFDRDRSGAISSIELKQVLIALNFNPTDDLLRKVMKEMDIDGNGSSMFEYFSFKFEIFFCLVEFDEFVKIMRKVYERKFTDDEMRRAFKCFDRDNSGKRFLTENFICFIFL
jgi:Ca2+-binding EF-hand superfamily protein